jgi:molybdopterin molybdotransferase
MIPVFQAQQIILEHARPGVPQVVPLTPAALGLVLAEDVVSDIDMPQCDKSMMDGFAVRSSDLAAGQTILTVIEEVTAGRLPQQPVGPGQATRIMTGAPMPAGADAVVAVERTRMLDEHRVQIDERVAAGKNVLPRAREMRRGETVLKKGTVLRPQVLGVLATVGRTAAAVHPAPAVAIIPTGDEIVEVSQTPGPQQVRNSNAALLAGQIARAGGEPHYLGIARDTAESLRTLIREGLKSPVLVLSGGVSAGKLDLVPGALQELGVQAHFHKVQMKPGKPIFFGTRSEGSSCLVFGLPGNPVSSLVCFELFVRPAIRRLLGHADPGTQPAPLPLAEDFAYTTDRPTYHPARVEGSPEGWRVRVVPWFGSADLRALADANALVLFQAGEQHHRAGQLFPVLRMDD